MRLRRIAVGGAVLGLVGVVVRAEGRAVGRVLLGRSDARVSTPGAAATDRRAGSESAARVAVDRVGSESVAGVAIDQAGSESAERAAVDPALTESAASRPAGARERLISASGVGERPDSAPAAGAREQSVATSGAGVGERAVSVPGAGTRKRSVAASAASAAGAQWTQPFPHAGTEVRT
mgnify:CR=1 FL=1